MLQLFIDIWIRPVVPNNAKLSVGSCTNMKRTNYKHTEKHFKVIWSIHYIKLEGQRPITKIQKKQINAKHALHANVFYFYFPCIYFSGFSQVHLITRYIDMFKNH